MGVIGSALQQLRFDSWDKLALVLVGPTGCGKTVWARRHAPKPALFVRHLDRLREFNPNYHKSIIFDDMKFTHMPTQAQIHLVDQYCHSDIHCRYTTASIPPGTPKIFTCNERPFEDHPAIRRRIHYVQVNIDWQ